MCWGPGSRVASVAGGDCRGLGRDDRLAEGAGLGPVATAGTTHISVVDADGLCAALTLSNGVGGGVFLPGTGMHLNNMMGEDDLHPGRAASAILGERIRSMMAPAIVDHHGGMLVLGTGGSERIRMLTRVITLLLGGDADLAGAVEAPRVRRQTAGPSRSNRAYPGRRSPTRRAGAGHFVAGTALLLRRVNAVPGHRGRTAAGDADPRRGARLSSCSAAGSDGMKRRLGCMAGWCPGLDSVLAAFR